jgi:NDP-sugar pyrophosphorylase family protein
LCTDINPLYSNSSEREDYPTQKPEELLERIIDASTDPGDIVFDCFMGSGTTQAVAMKMGRKFLGADINLGAVQTTTSRLERIMTNSKNEEDKYLNFELYNVNNYDIFRNPTEAKELLIKALEKYCSADKSDFGHHVLPPMIEKNDVYAYEYESYWRDVGTLDSFWETNLSLTDAMPELNLYEKGWRIHTKSVENPPVKFGPNSKTSNSLLSNGAIINGTVENSVISPGVYIEENVVVRDSVIFNNTVVRKNSIIDKAIIDKEVEIGENCHIGFGDDLTPNQEQPELLFNGLNIIAKRAIIPNNVQIGRNCRVMSYARPKDFDNKNIESGSTIG